VQHSVQCIYLPFAIKVGGGGVFGRSNQNNVAGGGSIFLANITFVMFYYRSENACILWYKMIL